MWGKVFLLLTICLGLGFSVQQRIFLLKKRNTLDQMPELPISSLLSESLAQLVGVAGGVYLSLLMLVSFLELELPNKVTVVGMTMEPLAFIALALSILQPLVKGVLSHLAKRAK